MSKFSLETLARELSSLQLRYFDELSKTKTRLDGTRERLSKLEKQQADDKKEILSAFKEISDLWKALAELRDSQPKKKQGFFRRFFP